jgi:hypothetical protein
MNQDKNTHAQHIPIATQLQIDAEKLICLSVVFESPRAYLDFFTEMHIAHLNYIVSCREELDLEIVDLYENLYIFLKKVVEFSETHNHKKESSSH